MVWEGEWFQLYRKEFQDDGNALCRKTYMDCTKSSYQGLSICVHTVPIMLGNTSKEQWAPDSGQKLVVQCY